MRPKSKPERPSRRGRRRSLAVVAWLGIAALFSLALAGLAGADPAVALRSLRSQHQPGNSRPPSISGAAVEGQVLHASRGHWRHADRARFSYAWQRCGASTVSCLAIPGATDSIYALGQADVGNALRVVVTATTQEGSIAALSRLTPIVAAAPPGAPVNTAPPAVVGSPMPGATLTVNAGTWQGNLANRVRIAWRRCNGSGGSCVSTDRTGQSYLVRRSDTGHTLRVLVTEQNSIGTGAALSGPTGVVGGVSLPQALAPRNVSRPTITGTLREGSALAASTGSWSGTTPMTFSFAWLRCRPSGSHCSTVRRGPQTYALTAADVGHSLRVLVSARNKVGSSSAFSAATGEIQGPSAPTKPSNHGEPRILGTPQVGRVLTATNGTWSGTEPIGYAYRWRRCNGAGLPDASNCALIGSGRATYTVQAADVGHRLRVQVVASNAAGSAMAASNATGTVTWGSPANTVSPAITGTARPGRTLTVNRGTWSGQQPITYGFQWLRCAAGNGDNCVEIAGQTRTHYVVSTADVGRSVRVRVTAQNAGGTQSVTSSFRNVVGAPAPPPSGGVIILRNGEKSIPVTSVPSTARLIVSQVVFSPRPVRSATAPIIVRIRVTDTRGYVVRGALVFVRATPRVTSTGNGQQTATDGWVTYGLVPNGNFPRPRTGYHVQFFVKAYRAGDPVLAGVAGYRLVQVPLAG